MNKLDLALAIDRYWAIEPSVGQGMISLLGGMPADVNRAVDTDGGLFDPDLHAYYNVHWAARPGLAVAFESAKKRTEDDSPSPAQRMMPVLDDGTALIPIIGAMTKRPAGSFGSPGTATIGVRRMLRVAAADPVVKRILLVLDSPGGQISGLIDLADDVQLARNAKPVLGYVEDICASACLWVASQCDALYAGRGADIGSIGVYAAIPDVSAQAAMYGVKVHLLSTGDYKGAGVPGVPISQKWLDDWQQGIDESFGQFIGAVASGRQMDEAAVRAIADGRTYPAARAIELGLIDGICSMDECLELITNSDAESARKSAASNGTFTGEPKMADNKKPSLWEGLKAFLTTNGIDVEAEAAGGVKEAGGDGALIGVATPTREATTTHHSMQGAQGGPVQTAPVLDPAVAKSIEDNKAQTDALVKQMAKQRAESFADTQVKDDKKAMPAEHDSIAAMFLNALCADGGGSPRFEGESLVEGVNCKAIRDHFAARPKLDGLTQVLVGASTNGATLDPNTKQDAMTPERRRKLLNATATGQVAARQLKEERN